MFTSSYLLITLVFSSIGVGYFIYGKKQKHKIAYYSGIGLMGYPYLFTDSMLLIGIGVALMLVPKFVKQ